MLRGSNVRHRRLIRQNGRLMQQIQTAPDSLVRQYVINMAERELLLQRADSAKVTLTP